MNKFKNLKKTLKSILNIKDKFKSATLNQRKQIRTLGIVCISGISIIAFFQLASFSSIKLQFVSPSSEHLVLSPKVQTPEPQLAMGFDLLDPVGSIVNPIIDSITSVVKQVVGLYDNYVGFTPDIAEHDGNIKDADGKSLGISLDKFYNLVATIAWILLPLMIMINGTMIILEGSFRGRELALQIVKKLLMFAVGMVVFRFFISFGIQLINGLDSSITNGLIGQGAKLSDSLLSALGVGTGADGKMAFQDQGTFNVFAQLILCISMFFFMLTILFQFIIRFFYLILNFVLFPIIMIVGLLPGGGQFFKSYMEDMIRSLATQPVFLVGLAITVSIIQSGTGSITKLMLGLGSLLFLNTINSFVARFAGMMWSGAAMVGAGIVGAATIGTALGNARLLKKAGVKELTGENSGSMRMASARMGFKAIGEKLGLGTPYLKQNGNKPEFSTASHLIGNQKTQGSFGKALSFGTGGTESAFASLGMNPLGKDTLKTPGKMNLFSTKPDLTGISKVSMQDSQNLSKSFNNSHFDSFMGNYPLTEIPKKLDQMVDMNNFRASNPDTISHMSTAIPASVKAMDVKSMFDTTDPTHSTHLQQWYAKNESISGKTKFNDAYKFAQNPNNQMNVLRRASSEGYFKSQGIKFVKTQDQINGEAINKYYQLPHKNHAGSSATKTKSK